MAEKLDQTEIVPVEEALKMEMIINQAMVDLLAGAGSLSLIDNQ